MTTLRSRSSAALLSSIALCGIVLLAGCSASPPTEPDALTDPAPSSSSAPAEESGNAEGTNGVPWAPSADICSLESSWNAIALKLDEGQVQETPAPGFAEALALAEAFTPSPSIEEDWSQVMVLLGDYVDVLATGDQAAIDSAYPQKIQLVDVRIRYNFAFLDFC